jgi:aspartokinase/homoserine dehydrogenase 1
MTRILKFGGSSLASPERVRAVAGIVADASTTGSVVVVVSAFGGATDALLGAARAAEAGAADWERRLAGVRERHFAAAMDLALPGDLAELTARLEAIHADLDDLVRGVFMVREASPRTMDRVVSVGERVSAECVAAAMRHAGLPARSVDARTILVTDDRFGGATVQEDETNRRVREALNGDGIPVVTGFIASNAAGETTTLGRGGSDYTASILGAALDASAVELWTDVDGVLSADPRIVHDAVLSDRLSYDELMELSHFGAKVVHPPSVRPTRSRRIPLFIRNTFRPDGAGTRVDAEPAPMAEDGRVVRGIASIPNVTLLRLEGPGMVGVQGIAMRLFGALAREGVSVILITQASSEHSICFAVSPQDTDAAARSVEAEFAAERRAGLVDPLVIERELSVVAAVGAGMRERSGVAGRLFAVLGRHGVNVRAIAQGSSELNISLVVAAEDEARTIRAIHDAFFVSGERTVDVYLAGVGRVGGALLEQIAAQADALARDRHLRLRLAGAASSRGAALDEAGRPARTRGSRRWTRWWRRRSRIGAATACSWTARRDARFPRTTSGCWPRGWP